MREYISQKYQKRPRMWKKVKRFIGLFVFEYNMSYTWTPIVGLLQTGKNGARRKNWNECFGRGIEEVFLGEMREVFWARRLLIRFCIVAVETVVDVAASFATTSFHCGRIFLVAVRTAASRNTFNQKMVLSTYRWHVFMSFWFVSDHHEVNRARWKWEQDSGKQMWNVSSPH